MEVDEGSDQKSDVWPQSIAAHAYLKNEFTEGDKCQNLMSRLINYLYRTDSTNPQFQFSATFKSLEMFLFFFNLSRTDCC